MSQQESAPGAVGSMVCGIISIVVCWLPFVGLILGIIALVLSGKARRAAADEPGRYATGMATAGLVCGIIGTVLGGLYLIYWVVAVVFIKAAIDEGIKEYEGARLVWDVVARRYL